MAIYSEFSHEKLWFSIVMLVYQRVYVDYMVMGRVKLPLKLQKMTGGESPSSYTSYFRVGYQGFDTKSRARADRDLDFFQKRGLFVRTHGMFNVITYTTKHMPSYAD